MALSTIGARHRRAHSGSCCCSISARATSIAAVPLAFAADARALALAKGWIGRDYHHALPAPLAAWFIMPFEHAEDLDAQRRGVALFQTMGLSEMAHWAQIHLDIIARFGRFPHRNPMLGRRSTPEELAFLAAGGFAG